MYPALIIALSSSALYFKHLNATSTTRLLQLFSSFANPKFLLADEGHQRLLFLCKSHCIGPPKYILRTMTQGSKYSTPPSPKHPSDNRIQRAKEEQSQDTKGMSRVDREEHDQAHEEKQRMLERENALGISNDAPSTDSVTEVRVIP